TPVPTPTETPVPTPTPEIEISVKISKVDIADGAELPGATIQIIDKDGNVVEEWISTNVPHEVTGLKPGETYILSETVAPDGYTVTTDTIFRFDENGEIDENGTTTTVREDGVLLVEDDKTSVKISKVDVADGEELEGAEIQILDKDGNIVEEWTSGKEPHEVTGLKTGETYTLRETVAPDGYEITTDTTFVLDEKGEIDKTKTTTTVSEEGVLLVEDDKTSVKISKVDVADGEELEGAEIQILDKDGNIVEEWTSGKEPHEVTGLKTGETYTLRETVAPDGYEITTDTTFVLDEKGEIDKTKTTTTVSEEGVLLVEDAITSVKISKVDIADGAELEGATIQILDKDGKVVEEWVSAKEPHEVKGLKVGETYTLRETVAPTGYDITTDTTFVLDEYGNILGGTTTVTEDDILLVEDSKTLISISGTKIWNDGDNQDGKRPGSITVHLLADGKEVDSAVVKGDEVDEDGNWTFVFEDLEEYNGTEKIVYTITEDAVKDYETAIDGTTITNTHIPETTEVAGEKVWDDADNRDGKRPESITVNLYAGKDLADTQVVKADENGAWTFRFENLAKYADGQLITYTVKEASVADYSTTYPANDDETDTAIIIKNTYTPGETSKTVTKVWEDSDNRAGARPDEITVQLLADGEAYGDAVTLNAENEWTYTWEKLPAMSEGEEITYSVQEISQPDGYVTTYSEDTFIIKNKAITFNVNKVELNNNEKEVEDAVLTVYDKETGEEVDYWISKKGETYDFGPSLKPGRSYILEETMAPFGYQYTTDIEFTVGEDGSITTEAKTTVDESGNTVYLVEDAPVEAEISKVDALTGEDLEGATLRITDKEGNVVEEWVTDGEGSHLITAKLGLGETYTLTETEAPENYQVAEPITFTVSEAGEVDPIIMKDARIKSEKASITVTKNLTMDGDPLSAIDQTFYVGLYLDAECTQLAGEIKPIVFKNASSSSAVFTGLDIGRTYYIGECDENGVVMEIGTVESGDTFFANFTEGNEAVIEEEDGSVTIFFENEFLTIPDGFFIGGKLDVTKYVVNVDGEEMESDETFYAGIFDDADYTIPSVNVGENILTLEMGGGSSVTASTSVALPETGADVTLYVTEVDENGVPVEGAEGFMYTVSQDVTEVTMNQENTYANVVIINSEITEEEITPKVTPTVTPTSIPSPTVTPGGSTTRTGVKTGDDTPIGLYLALLAASCIMLGTTGYRRRRRNNK
ncbi:MAG: SpaA isopeptide-forming pilin-related protein, partial [Eubacteriales bacterium]|nr:SpaA isopeptide-forming pilin-related protein [Eubacteriales bacterium]